MQIQTPITSENSKIIKNSKTLSQDLLKLQNFLTFYK